MVSGAATCFYAFIGFDTIATSGEESSKPTQHVPVAIVSTLVICLVAYVGVSSVVTLLVPWDQLSSCAALPNAFAQVTPHPLPDVKDGAIQGCSGAGKRGTASPAFFDSGDASPTPPHFFGLKFVQKLVHRCNWLLTLRV